MPSFNGLVEWFLIFRWGNDLCLVDVLDEGIARYVFRSEKLLKGAWRRPLLDRFTVNSTQLEAGELTRRRSEARPMQDIGCNQADGAAV